MPDREDDRTVPLCVDLDGTLVRTDTLHEAMLELLKQAPHAFARVPGWMLKGKAETKYRVAERIKFEASHLPFRPEVLRLIEEARAAGRPVVLTTAAAPQIAHAVAEHLGLFELVFSSDVSTNLSAEEKARRLVAHYGEGGFDYVGNSKDDLAVWRKARRVIIVSNNSGLYKRAASHGQQIESIRNSSSKTWAWGRSLRPHQWLKNLLVFVPLFAAQRAGVPGPALSAVLAFVAFSLSASAVYILNDLLDLPSDRRHRRKRRRPFASGELSVRSGALSAACLLSLALVTALFLPPLFIGVLGFYILITSAYSFRLKRRVILDVVLLAGLYTLRVIAGSAATDIAPSFWLLAFSMFLFLSLGIVKRYSELQIATDEKSVLPGRGYVSSDLPVLLALGAGSGLMAVMVLALFVNSPAVVNAYAEARWMWLVPPTMLYWVARLWMKTHRGEVDDDPVIFAARDKQSLIIMCVLIAVFSAAVFGLPLPG